ncbi:excinuclease ABC subunit UvrA [Patescibacteria group bacterium AH-259-L05]|nr:excinuclease ABC subunit UvrA [Patescibacteria group bacterium AH-259-L05]
MKNKIIIKGAKIHNLKNINLELPKNKLVVFTGVSGSGKSSLAFDTIFAEGQRRYIESLSPYARQFLGKMDRPDVDEIIGLSPAIAIDQKALSHNPRSIVGTLTEIYDYLRVLFARLGEVYCPQCKSRIEKLTLEEMVDIIVSRAKELKQETVTILSPVVRGRKGEYHQLLYDFLNLGFSQARVDGKFRSLHDRLVLSRYKVHSIEIVIDKVMPSDESRMFEAVEGALHHSKGLITAVFNQKSKNSDELLLSSQWSCPKDGFSFGEIEPRLFSFNSPYGACDSCHGLGKTDLFLRTQCPMCKGKRLKPESLSIKINDKNIYGITTLTIDETYTFFTKYKKKITSRDFKIARKVLNEIIDRLEFLLLVGLDYLSLNREAETLSGGEAQRIRLASQIGSQLSDTLYVLDEPTIGLHERDIDRLLSTIKSLRDQNNTVIVVEHDERTVRQSDYLVDLGPLAGKRGGKVVVSGKIDELLNGSADKNSLTLKYLKGDKKISLPQTRRKKIRETLKIYGAKAHNLKSINVDIPLRKLIVITGVSGSGKSTLLYDVLYKNVNKIKAWLGEDLDKVNKILGTEYIDKVIMINQSPIGRTPRSNPATYTGIFTPVREFYASLEEAQARGYTLSRFSFNVSGGRCEACKGAGYNLVEMHFLPPVLVKCDICHGKRFNRETLQVSYKEKNIAEVLTMNVDEAYDFFKDHYVITDKLKVLKEVGLGYVELGQSATTLSGGEAQRIKLARELTHRLGRRSLYLLDEPTVGLHYHDIEMLLKVLNRLVERGNTVMIIEHNMHVIKCADYIIDLGPEGGEKGGDVVATGTPEEIVQYKKSYTGQHLEKYLKTS